MGGGGLPSSCGVCFQGPLPFLLKTSISLLAQSTGQEEGVTFGKEPAGEQAR